MILKLKAHDFCHIQISIDIIFLRTSEVQKKTINQAVLVKFSRVIKIN